MLQVSEILGVVVNQLDMILKTDMMGGVTTPPPSPSLSGDSEDSNSMDGAGAVTSSNTTGSLLQTASARAIASSQQGSKLRQLSPVARTVASLALKCLAHIFTWSSLPSALAPRLLNCVFQFAALEVRNGSGESSRCLTR